MGACFFVLQPVTLHSVPGRVYLPRVSTTVRRAPSDASATTRLKTNILADVPDQTRRRLIRPNQIIHTLKRPREVSRVGVTQSRLVFFIVRRGFARGVGNDKRGPL